MANENYPPIRRVITGHDMNNVAKVMYDAPATNAKRPGSGVVSTLMWVTDSAGPAKIPVGDNFEDMGARIVGTAPAPKGTRFCVIDFPPGNHPGHAPHRDDRLRHRPRRRDRDGHGRLDREAQAGRHHDPAWDQPRLGKPQR